MIEQEKCLGKLHFDTIETVIGISSVNEGLGEYTEAEDNFKAALDCLKELYGNRDHPWIFYTLSGQADICIRLGKYTDAEKIYKEIYEGFKRLKIGVPGEYPTATNLSRVLRFKGQYKEALGWAKEAEEQLKKNAAADHPSTLMATFSIAVITELQGRHTEAVKLHQEVLKSFQKKFGDEHSSTMVAMCSLVNVYARQGLYDMATETYTKAEKILESTLGKYHQLTLGASLGLAEVSVERGQLRQSSAAVRPHLGRFQENI